MKMIDVDALINEIKKETEKAIKQDDRVGAFWLGYAAGMVIKQPTIQPEKTQLSQESTTSDLISRQAAIDALDVLCQEHRYRIPGKRETYSEYNEAWQDALGRAEGVIGNLPTIQPEPHEGHWIWVVGDLECSECHTRYPDLYPDYADSVACPHCGARMKGER